MINLDSVRFNDGSVVSVGDRVKFTTSHGGEGEGILEAIVKPTRGASRFKVNPTTWTPGKMDSWDLRDGGRYCYPKDHGLYGCQISPVSKENPLFPLAS